MFFEKRCKQSDFFQVFTEKRPDLRLMSIFCYKPGCLKKGLQTTTNHPTKAYFRQT
jgi:hypothetical protein